ncbi:YceD family protein [Polynucleobacter necessarius]|uniref:YceD family protein n=1 Tax=Polynucleobacter necessarius TaxID=576610 RepID=UPI000E091EF6|nr:YceD family protein [Polynucleobacter necessarius]
MNRNQVLPQVQLSSKPSALKRVDFCVPQSYKGSGFWGISELPRLAKEASTVVAGDGFNWALETHFEDSPGSEPHQAMDWGFQGWLHLICQRCLQDCAVDLTEKRRFILVATEEEADAYPPEDEEQEPLVVSQHFNLLETIEDEVLLSLPLIPKHPEGFCESYASVFGEGADEGGSDERENPFNVLKNMKKN